VLLVDSSTEYRVVNIFFSRIIGFFAWLTDRSDGDQLEEFRKSAEEALMIAEKQAQQAFSSNEAILNLSSSPQLNGNLSESVGTI